MELNWPFELNCVFGAPGKDSKIVRSVIIFAYN